MREKTGWTVVADAFSWPGIGVVDGDGRLKEQCECTNVSQERKG
jgi:hypothetical protein